MVSTLLLGAGLIVALPAASPTPTLPDVAAIYEEARAKAGRDPEAHVKLALWCEKHGREAERLKHLTIAVLIDRRNAVARGLLGFVAYQGRWLRPDDVGRALRTDAVLAEYNARRARTPNLAEAQWKLALWCEEKGLTAEATAHFTAVTRLDPAREAAWKRLGYKKSDGHWATDAQRAEQKALAQRLEAAERHWKPLLTRWRGWLGDDRHRAGAEAAMVEVTDPLAVPSVCAVFATGGPARQAVAVRLLGQIDSPPSSRALALLAVFGATAEVRRTATETLNRRDPREFASVLAGLLRDPIKYQVRPVNGPGSENGLFLETSGRKLARRYVPTLPRVPIAASATVFPDEFGLPVIYQPLQTTVTAKGGQIIGNLDAEIQFNQRIAQSLGSVLGSVAPGLAERYAANMNSGVVAERSSVVERLHHPSTSMTLLGPRPDRLIQAQITYEQVYVGQMLAQAQENAAALVQARIARDVESIERYNAPIAAVNARTLSILSQISGQDLGEDREAWQKWSTDLAGYALQTPDVSDTPTVVEDVPVDVAASPAVSVNVSDGLIATLRMPMSHSCFGARTPVRTLVGLRPIEAIRPGDQVLTRDARTGALRYQPVVTAYHNPPNATLRVQLGHEVIVVTGIHRFWKAGQGWVMARDLHPGDPVRSLGGSVAVGAVEKGPVQPVFNLEVADGQSFLVGELGVLVHDNSMADPVTDPFDAAPALATTAPAVPADRHGPLEGDESR